MSIDFLREALAAGDDVAFLRYAHLHLGDGNEAAGKLEVDKAYIFAIKSLMDMPRTSYPMIRDFIAHTETATLAHLFLYAHLELVRRSGNWIHDGDL